jgi:hypothetical protein
MTEPEDDDVMISQAVLQSRDGSTLLDLFVVYGRRQFGPNHEALAALYPRWLSRGSKQRLARDIQSLITKGYLQRLADGCCKITTKQLMTGREYKEHYPDAEYKPGFSRPSTE